MFCIHIRLGLSTGMSDTNSTTESLPQKTRWLDQLDDAAAMAVMAED